MSNRGRLVDPVTSGGRGPKRLDGRIYQVALIIELRDDKIWRLPRYCAEPFRHRHGRRSGWSALTSSWIIPFTAASTGSDVSRRARSRGAARCDGGQLAEVAARRSADQREFVAATTYYLCGVTTGRCGVRWPSSLTARVGFVMWALDDNDGSHWIGGLVVDATR